MGTDANAMTECASGDRMGADALMECALADDRMGMDALGTVL